jgi:chaperonin GroES
VKAKPKTALTLNLLHDGVLVKIVEKDRTPGGLYIPDTSRGDENLYEGLVIAVGPGRYLSSGQLIPPGFEAGDSILFGSGRGLDVTIEGEKFRALTCGDILGVFPTTKPVVH